MKFEIFNDQMESIKIVRSYTIDAERDNGNKIKGIECSVSFYDGGMLVCPEYDVDIINPEDLNNKDKNLILTDDEKDELENWLLEEFKKSK